MTEDTVDRIVVGVTVVLIWTFCTRQLHNTIRGKKGSAQRDQYDSSKQRRKIRKKNRKILKESSDNIFYLDSEGNGTELYWFLRLWGWVRCGDKWTNVRTRWEREVQDDAHSYHLTLWFGADQDKTQEEES